MIRRHHPLKQAFARHSKDSHAFEHQTMSASLLARGVLRNSAAMRSPMKQAVQKRQIREWLQKAMAPCFGSKADMYWPTQISRTPCKCITGICSTEVGERAESKHLLRGFLRQTCCSWSAKQDRREKLTWNIICHTATTTCPSTTRPQSQFLEPRLPSS